MKKISKSSYHTGFTIVELLIVVVVIAILAALIISTFAGLRGRSENEARIYAAQATVKAINAYYATSGTLKPIVDAIPSYAQVCAGSGHKDHNNDGVADCSTYPENGTIKDASRSNSTVDTLLLSGGTRFDGTSPRLDIGNTEYGPQITNYPVAVDGIANKLQVRYYLDGVDVDCQLHTLKINSNGTSYTNTASNKNTSTYDNVTVCIIGFSAYTQ